MKNKNSNSKSNLWILLTALLVFAISVFISIVTRILLMWDSTWFDFNQDQASLITSMLEGIISAISIGFLIYQLKASNDIETRQNEISESDFLFRYNQAFLTNKEMADVELHLDEALESGNVFDESALDGRQSVTNYLVYLEGLAPLMLSDTISFDYADDLFAYRFFLALNNESIENTHLFRYPQYYQGCFKLYHKWKNYRLRKGEDILVGNNGTQLDDWLFFELFAQTPVRIYRLSECKISNSVKTAAGLIYSADPYIYPAAFGTDKSYAVKAISYLINNSVSYFNKSNIYIAELNSTIVGVTVVLDNENISNIDCNKLRSKFPLLPKSFELCCEEVFNHAKDHVGSDFLYLCSIAVDESFRRQRIGKKLIACVVRDNIGKNLNLSVLCDNTPAIKLYEKCGFETNKSNALDGFSASGKRPKIYSMTRIAKPEDVLATNNAARFSDYFVRG